MGREVDERPFDYDEVEYCPRCGEPYLRYHQCAPEVKRTKMKRKET